MKLYSHLEYFKFGSKFGFGRKPRSRFGVDFVLSDDDPSDWIAQILDHYHVDETYEHPEYIRLTLFNSLTRSLRRPDSWPGTWNYMSRYQINSILSDPDINSIGDFMINLGIRHDAERVLRGEPEDRVAPPAPPVGGPEPLPPVELLDLTSAPGLNDSLSATDYIEMTDVSIRDHTAASPDNVSIIWQMGGNYFVAHTTKDMISSRNKNRVVYECGPSIPDSALYTPASGIVRRPLLNLQNVGVTLGGFAYLDQPYDGEPSQVYFLEPVGSVARVVAHNMVFGDEHGVRNAVGALHCQPGNGGVVYQMRPARIRTSPASSAYGRRRKKNKN